MIEELKKIAGSDADEDDEDEAAMLMEESTMPIEELLKRIKVSIWYKVRVRINLWKMHSNKQRSIKSHLS